MISHLLLRVVLTAFITESEGYQIIYNSENIFIKIIVFMNYYIIFIKKNYVCLSAKSKAYHYYAQKK